MASRNAVLVDAGDACVLEECQLPSEYGDCDRDQYVLSYNRRSKTCGFFTYSGCGGNGNKFERMEDCLNNCISSSGSSGTSVCKLSKHEGRYCEGKNETRFYYDTKSSSCRLFNYGGCDGNGNNFKSWKGCSKECIPGGGDIRNSF